VAGPIRLLVRIIVVALVAGCVTVSPGPATTNPGGASTSSNPSSPAAGRPTFDPSRSAWENVLAGIGPNGEIGLQTALDAFYLAFGPLPGTSRPPGDDGPIIDGTLALRALRRHWDELTADQQAAADRLIHGQSPTASAARPLALAATVTTDVGVGSGQPPADPVTEGWQQLAEQAAAAIAGKLGRTLHATIAVQLNQAVPANNPKVWDAWAYTWGEDGQGGYTGPMATCHIAINPQGQGMSGVEQYAIAAHEVFHCYQFDVGTLAAHANEPEWIIEGSAAWVGEDIAGGTNEMVGWWAWWLTTPQANLFGRTYDAIGLLALLGDVGVDPWSVMDKFLLAGINGSEAAYVVLRTAGGDAFLDTWGPRYAMTPANGSNWLFVGTGLVAGLPEFQGQIVNAAPGASVELQAGDHAALQFNVALNADVVAFDSSTTHGLAQIKVGEDQSLDNLVAHPLCTAPGGCTCPSGTAGTGTSFQQAPAGALVQVGFAGDDAGAGVQVTGLNLDDFCQQAHVDPCLVGTWISTYFTAPDHDISGGTGIILTIGADGTVTEDYDLMDAAVVTPTVQPVPEVPFSVDVQWFGTASGHIRAVDGGWFLLDADLTDQLWSIYVTVAGTRNKVFDHATAAEVGAAAGGDQTSGVGDLAGFPDGAYECGNGELTLKPASSLAQSNWVKQ
jgi:hypothetical protein